jgi:hypothetical protein
MASKVELPPVRGAGCESADRRNLAIAVAEPTGAYSRYCAMLSSPQTSTTRYLRPPTSDRAADWNDGKWPAFFRNASELTGQV